MTDHFNKPLIENYKNKKKRKRKEKTTSDSENLPTHSCCKETCSKYNKKCVGRKNLCILIFCNLLVNWSKKLQKIQQVKIESKQISQSTYNSQQRTYSVPNSSSHNPFWGVSESQNLIHNSFYTKFCHFSSSHPVDLSLFPSTLSYLFLFSLSPLLSTFYSTFKIFNCILKSELHANHKCEDKFGTRAAVSFQNFT